MCLHWILDIETAIKNISKCLKSNGTFQFVFLEHASIEKILILLANTPKYQKYKNDILSFPYFKHCVHENFHEFFGKILKENGFNVKYSESKIQRIHNCKSEIGFKSE